jgi:hypothetical protein
MPAGFLWCDDVSPGLHPDDDAAGKEAMKKSRTHGEMRTIANAVRGGSC